jgi:hypothetical protein
LNWFHLTYELLAWPSCSPGRITCPNLGTQTPATTNTGRRRTHHHHRQRRILRLSRRWPWTDLITNGDHHLAALT